MLWIFILMIHYVHSRPNDTPSINMKHCIKMSSAKDREITNVLAKFTDFLNRIADEHEEIDIPFINIHIENHSDDESEEKDMKLRVLINDCHDFGVTDDNSNKYVDKKDITDLYSKNIKANNIAIQDSPKNKTLLDIVVDQTKEIEKLKNLLNVCNKVKVENEEISENDKKITPNNKNNQFSPKNSDFVINEPTKASNKNVTDSVVIEDKDLSATHKNIEDTLKITQDMARNVTNFEIIDQPTMKNVSDINDDEIGPESYKNLKNSNEVTQKVSPNDTHAEINTSAKRNQWKVRFIKVIENLLDDRISDIQFITDNNDDSDGDVDENSFIKKSKFSDFNLVDDLFDNNFGKIAGSGIEDSKNDIEINKQREDTIIIVDTYPGIDEFINLGIKDDTEKDHGIKTDVQYDTLEVKEDLQNINTADVFSVNINSEHNENDSHENVKQEYNPINKGNMNKDNDASKEIAEELIPNLKQKAPEVLPLNLEENGEELVQMIEGKRDKSKPILVYIQEKNEHNEYVFFSKK